MSILGLGNLGNSIVPNQPIPDQGYSKVVEKADSAPSKLDLAIQHFKDHPEDKNVPGRDLEKTVKPGGVKISYKYWNTAKKQV